jgi:hypothetical protein
MFTGTMTESEMRHEHPLELESLLADPPPAVDEVARGRRRRVFWPVCVVVTLTLAAGLVWFVTLEDTALPVKPSATTAAPAGS